MIHAHDGGAILAVKNQVFYEQIQLKTDLQAIAIIINLPNDRKISICYIYLSLNLDISKQDLQSIIH